MNVHDPTPFRTSTAPTQSDNSRRASHEQHRGDTMSAEQAAKKRPDRFPSVSWRSQPEASRSTTRGSRPSTASISTGTPAASSASAAPTAPASPPSPSCWPGWKPRPTARSRSPDYPHPVRNAAEAEQAGVLMMHQEPLIIDDFTVGENVWLYKLREGKDIRPWAQKIDTNNAETRKVLQGVGLGHLSTRQLARDLGPGQRQMLSLSRAAVTTHKIMILDETTASTSEEHFNDILDLVEREKKAGTSIIFVSHRLNEVFAMCDRIAVLRNGKLIKILNAADTNADEITSLMIGQALKALARPAPVQVRTGPGAGNVGHRPLRRARPRSVVRRRPRRDRRPLRAGRQRPILGRPHHHRSASGRSAARSSSTARRSACPLPDRGGGQEDRLSDRGPPAGGLRQGLRQRREHEPGRAAQDGHRVGSSTRRRRRNGFGS